MSTINIRIPDELAGRLGVLANQTGRTKSYYIRQAIEEKLEELEDHYLAMQSLENIATGKSKVWTQQELEQENDLAN
jgi:RHH-type rel operon transcriptional repressor/antitoxin RelB